MASNKPPVYNSFGGDATATMTNQGYVIVFVHIPTKEKVAFKAFLTNFNDSYTADWDSETVYGRMDPLTVYRGTRRRISLGWKTVAATQEEAEFNLNCVSHLIKMLYPTYSHPSKGAATEGPSIIHQPPLLRMRFSNWVTSVRGMKANIPQKAFRRLWRWFCAFGR